GAINLGQRSYRRVGHSHLQGARKRQADHDDGARQHADRDQSAFAIASHNKRAHPLVERRSPRRQRASPRNLGWRESGTAKFEEAVTVYREALKEQSRERVPLAWAQSLSRMKSSTTAEQAGDGIGHGLTSGATVQSLRLRPTMSPRSFTVTGMRG